MTSNLIIIKLFKQIVENKLYEFSTRLEYDHPEYGTLIFRSWMSYGYVSITLSLRNIQTNMFYDQDKGNVGIKNSRDDKLFLSLDDIQNDMDETEFVLSHSRDFLDGNIINDRKMFVSDPRYDYQKVKAIKIDLWN